MVRSLVLCCVLACLLAPATALVGFQSIVSFTDTKRSNGIARSEPFKAPACVRARAPIRLRGGAAGATSSATKELILKTIAPMCGIVVSVSMFIAPLPAVLKARKEGSLGNVNPLPYPAQIGNCAAWLLYAVAVQNVYVAIPNIFGLMLGTFFTWTGLSLAKAEMKATLKRNLFVYVAAVATAVMVNHFKLVQISSQNLFGWVGNILLMIYYTAPLSTISTVIKTKNADTLDPVLSIAGVFNGFFWFAYGVAIWDGYVAIPNGIGMLLASITSSCWFAFRTK